MTRVTACRPEESSRIALRTQQMLAYETGVTKTIDPLGGSGTSRRSRTGSNARSCRDSREIDAMGGMAHAIQSGWLETQINAARYRNQEQLDSGRTAAGRRQPVHDPCRRRSGRSPSIGSAPANGVRAARTTCASSAPARDAVAWSDALSQVETAWREGRNMVPVLMHALRAQSDDGRDSTKPCGARTAGEGPQR